MPATPSSADVIAALMKLSGEVVSLGSWMKNYPVGVGAPVLAAGGTAVGLLYHLSRKALDKKYKGSGMLAVALGLGVGAAAGHAYAASRSPDGIQKKLETELDNMKYDRFGPFRQALRGLRPVIPVREGTHDYPADFKAAVKDPITTLPDTVAYGGRVAPNDLRIAVGSPQAPAQGFWRKGFEGGKPKQFFTLDGPLSKLLGPPERSDSYTGSETLGSRSQHDYNGALKGLFDPMDNEAPLRRTDNAVVISGHGSSNPLSSVAGVTYKDILSELAQQGRFKGVNVLNLQTCNSEGCDIPNDVVRPALGRLPAVLTYTPPGASGTEHSFHNQQRFLREPDATGTRPMDQNWLQPKRVTTVQAGSAGQLEPESPAANQALVSPRIPTGLTRAAGYAASALTPSLLAPLTGVRDPVGSRIRGLTRPQDYVVNTTGPRDIHHPETWDTAKELLPKLKTQRPQWLRDDPFTADAPFFPSPRTE